MKMKERVEGGVEPRGLVGRRNYFPQDESAGRMIQVRHYTLVKTHGMCGSKSEPRGEPLTLVVTRCQRRLVGCNECTSRGGVLVTGAAVHVCRGRGVWELPILCAHFL